MVGDGVVVEHLQVFRGSLREALCHVEIVLNTAIQAGGEVGQGTPCMCRKDPKLGMPLQNTTEDQPCQGGGGIEGKSQRQRQSVAIAGAERLVASTVVGMHKDHKPRTCS